MLLLFAAVIVLWNWPESGQAAAADRQTPAPAAETPEPARTSAGDDGRAVPSTPSPTPVPTPHGTGSYVSASRPDGR